MASGVFGDPNSGKIQERLQELDAKIALGRRLGEIPPGPEPWSETRAAKERLALEFPIDPTEPMHADFAAFHGRQIEGLGRLDAQPQARLAQQVANDLQERTTPVSMAHSAKFNREINSFPRGSEIVDALLKEAEVAVNHFVEPGKRADTLGLLRLDRNLLELYAVHGRNIAAYRAAKERYGL